MSFACSYWLPLYGLSSSNQLKAWIKQKSDFFWDRENSAIRHLCTGTAISVFPWVSILLVHFADSGIVSLHNCVIGFLKHSLSLFPFLTLVLVLFLWRMLTDRAIKINLPGSLNSYNLLPWYLNFFLPYSATGESRLISHFSEEVSFLP